jgi:PAS domain S-box-containing protein
VLVTLVDLTERRKAEESLHMRDRAIQAVSQGIVITDPRRPDNPIIYTSPGFERLTGYPTEEVLGRNCRFLQGKDTDPGAVMHLRDSVREGRDCTVELLNYRKDGSTFWNSLTISPVFDAHGQITNFVGVQTDVTERRRLEEQFRQAQKMEAIGQLAGGVAHDFNNLLTVINGYSDMLLEQLAVEDPLHNIVAEIHKAGDRAATLTRQLLTVSRQQVLEPKIINLNAILADTERMLQRLIGEHVVLETRLGSALEAIKADPGQIEQILINLAVNARDAMPHGGQLTISTSSVMLDKDYCRQHHDLQAGSYVLLEVRDTGIGMNEATRSRIFEPFFTTKAVGKGTGLGLPTVHGIIKQSRGHIAVDTAPGQGTTFRVYFPRVQPSESLSDPGRRQGEMPTGTETVLLAEDEISVRALGSHILRACGYKVLEAMNGKVALQVARDYQGAIDLLVSDVVMPHLGGRELAEELLRERPQCKVLFLSGYVDDAILRHGVEDAAYAFLQKPFAPQTLAQKVRNVLDAKT